MTPLAFVQIGIATAVFIAAASSAKAWAVAPAPWRVVLTMVLYVVGNLIMLRLLRQVGMATAFSVSAVLQLVAVNLVAILVFGERIGVAEGIGIVLAIAGVALITVAPALGR